MKAIVLLSGGLDSSTVLAYAISRGFQCYALSFDYGQKQKAELQAAKALTNHLGIAQHRIIDLSALGQLGGSALTDPKMAVPEETPGEGEIPATYVPARNTIFLSFALGYAEVVGAFDIFIGASQIDYSNYPDCREEYFHAFEQMAKLGTKVGVEGDKQITIHTPLLHLSKAETIKLGLSLQVDYSKTVSCYQADEAGRACGLCAACELRRKGFEAAHESDPTVYVN
jgi:7-cyano-7-deazaguanine synthase